MNKDQNNFPNGLLYIVQWTLPKDTKWSTTLNPQIVPEPVEDLGDMAEANSVIDYIRSL